MLGVLKQRWTDTERRPLTVVNDRRRLVGDTIDAGDRRSLAAYLAEIDWASARGHRRPSTTRRRPDASNATPAPASIAARRCTPTSRPSRSVAASSTSTTCSPHTIRDLRRDHDFADTVRWRFRHLLVDEAQDLNPLQHALVDLLRVGPRRPVPRRRPVAGDLRLQRRRPESPRRRRDPLPRHRGDPTAGQPSVHAPDRRRRRPRAHRHRPAEPARVEPGRRPDRRSGSSPTTRPTRPATSPSSCCGATRTWSAPARSAVLARTNAQLGPIADAIERAGLPVRRHATAQRNAAAGRGPSGRRPRLGVAPARDGRTTSSMRRRRRRSTASTARRTPAQRSASPRTDATSTTIPSVASPPRCSTSCANSHSATAPRSEHGSPPPTRSTTRRPRASSCSPSTPQRDASGTPSW